MSVHKWHIEVRPFEGDHRWGVYWIATIVGLQSVPGKTRQDAINKAKKARRRFVHHNQDRNMHRHWDSDSPILKPEHINWWRMASTNSWHKGKRP